MILRVLVAVKEAGARQDLSRMLEGPSILLSFASPRPETWARLENENFDLVLVERSRLADPLEDSIRVIRQLQDEPDVVVLCEQENPRERATLIEAGCMAVIFLGLEPDVLERALRALVKRRRQQILSRHKAERRLDFHRLGEFVSASPTMQELLAVANRVVATDTSLLLLGETGVGKEWLARALHSEGPRAQGPFIAVNCGAIPESLLESELFGHEEGAFTGAIKARRGHFEVAHGGTLFLDEIAETPTHVQVKLLRVLQDHRIQRVGSEREIETDVRIIAATNRDLDEEIRAMRFRSDLFYRLGVMTLTIPPLRERREDIPALAQNVLNRFRTTLGRSCRSFRPEAIKALVAYGWPGNVRELVNVIERAVLLSNSSEIQLQDLPDAITRAEASSLTRGERVSPPSAASRGVWEGKTLRQARREVLDAFERTYLSGLLQQTGGRIGDTARRAGISPRSLFGKMQYHGLRKERFKQG